MAKMSRSRLVAWRVLQAVPVLFGIVLISFLLTRALPGDPAAYYAGPAADADSIQQIRVSMGLDQPLPLQFVSYVQDLLRGELGTAISTGQPVIYELTHRLPASWEPD